MIPKLFISYSHVDKEMCVQFKKHLKPLELAGEINVWYDKQLLPGDELNKEIIEKLTESDMVAFLVSPDFFDSRFIQEIEVEKALKMDKKVFPIILRDCNWQVGPISKYRACPEDGKALKSYPDIDSALTSVVKEIRQAVLNFSKGQSEKFKKYSLNPNWIDELKKSEVSFFHKNKDVLLLDDIFVFPDLKLVKEETTEKFLEKTISSEELADAIEDERQILLIGEEQSGKTSLAKMLYRQFFEKGCFPIYLDVDELRSVQVDRDVEAALTQQYIECSLGEYADSRKLKIAIVDDFHDISLNPNYQKKYLEELGKRFDKVLVIADKLIQMNESEYLIFSSFKQYEVLPFGHVKRNELIEKWYSVNEVETIEEKKLEELVDNATKGINLVIRGNVVPPKPVYVLTIIQTLELNKPGEYGLTSYGHCYQTLILHALNKQKIGHQDFDTYFNYLREFAFSIFLNSSKGLDEIKRKDFEGKYSSTYVIASHEVIRRNLILANIFEEKDGIVGFRYKYIYYFYVAKHIADKATDKMSKNILEDLLKNIHSEKNANILIFLIHHTKDQKIIDEILLHTMCVFDGVPEEKLDVKSLGFLTGLFDAIPKLLLEKKNVNDERKKRLESMDTYEGVNSKDSSEEQQDAVQENKAFNDMVKSARAVEIIGQVLRNYHGSLEKKDLKSLSDQGINVGLRFLKFYLNILETSKEQFIDLLNGYLKKRAKVPEDEKLKKEAKKIFLTLCYQMAFAVVWKISNSMGEDRLIKIVEEISRERADSPAVKLIEIIIKLEYSKDLPKKEIGDLTKDVEKDNPFSFRLLQHIVLQHLYLHSSNFSDRKWISDTLKIPVSHQLLIEEKKAQKK